VGKFNLIAKKSLLQAFFVLACLICYLIWRKVKYAALVGVLGLLLKTVPIQTGLSRISAILRWVVQSILTFFIAMNDKLIVKFK